MISCEVIIPSLQDKLEDARRERDVAYTALLQELGKPVQGSERGAKLVAHGLTLYPRDWYSASRADQRLLEYKERQDDHLAALNHALDQLDPRFKLQHNLPEVVA